MAESFTRLFRVSLNAGTLHELKSYAAEYYNGTRAKIIERICRGHLVHVDETKVNLQGSSGYVWVLTSHTEVAYIFSESREADLPHGLLDQFGGVLVSDFYAAYDSLPCPQQKCLIHLIRDLNDSVLDNPFDEELKAIVRCFGALLAPMIDSVHQHGLKRYFLRKHMKGVDRFYAHLVSSNLTTEAATKCRQRLVKNKDRLFTFLERDGVPWNNNNAEHAIKAFARLRRGIAGISTPKGIDEYLVLLSVFQTCEYTGLDFLDFLRSGETDICGFARKQPRPRRAVICQPF